MNIHSASILIVFFPLFFQRKINTVTGGEYLGKKKGSYAPQMALTSTFFNMFQVKRQPFQQLIHIHLALQVFRLFQSFFAWIVQNSPLLAIQVVVPCSSKKLLYVNLLTKSSLQTRSGEIAVLCHCECCQKHCAKPKNIYLKYSILSY